MYYRALDLWLHVASATVSIQAPVLVKPDNFSVTQSSCRPYDISSYNEIQTLDDLEAWQRENAGCAAEINLGVLSEQGMLLALNECQANSMQLLTCFNIITTGCAQVGGFYYERFQFD